MSSRSSSSRERPLLPVGRVTGHRGRNGELTVRGGEPAAQWLEVRRFWIGSPPRERLFAVEHSRAYRDRLVLKFEGIDDANEAEGLRGQEVWVAREDAPDPGDGLHYVADLVGMLVVDESGRRVGQVEGVIQTGGADVLRVRTGAEVPGSKEEDAEELLLPLAGDFVKLIDPDQRRIEARVPRELWELNRPNRSPD